MTKKRFTAANSAELRERGVRLFQENRELRSANAILKKSLP